MFTRNVRLARESQVLDLQIMYNCIIHNLRHFYFIQETMLERNVVHLFYTIYLLDIQCPCCLYFFDYAQVGLLIYYCDSHYHVELFSLQIIAFLWLSLYVFSKPFLFQDGQLRRESVYSDERRAEDGLSSFYPGYDIGT